MDELSLYILDLTQNSVAAGATRVAIRIFVDRASDRLVIVIEDNGRGMSEEFLQKVISPFTTTRKTRKVGLGIPMAKQICEMCEGSFDIRSEVGKGTALTLTFRLSHVDLPPMGDLAGTFLSLIVGSPEKPDFAFRFESDKAPFEFDTAQIREVLGGVPLTEPEVLSWIRDSIAEGLSEAGYDGKTL